MGQLINVLVIDDDEINNFLCQKVIQLSGFSDSVITCQSADEGLSRLNESVDQNSNTIPDIIFLDINMPLKNGWDFLNDFDSIATKIDKKVNIFMLSSSVYKDDITKAKESVHVTDYVTKPLTEEVLKKIKAEFYS